jgi:hypothetical protein
VPAAADDVVGVVDLLPCEAELSQGVEVGGLPLGFGDFHALEEFLAERPGAEGEAELEHAREGLLDFFQLGFGEAFVEEGLVVDDWGVVERERAHDVLDDAVHFFRGVAEVVERGAEGLVGDLEIAAAGQLLELHQREVGFDAGGVAIHEQADGAGGGDDGGLRVAVAVTLAE